ncbi:MAG: hypothetical protein U0931_18615 [Vulcanimicrobiota bacterium]
MTSETYPLPSSPLAWLAAFFKLLLTLAGAFVLLVLLLFLTNPRGHRSRIWGQLTACKSNCKNIATALEMYAADHKGRYPDRLQDLLQDNYLKTLPTCPAAGRVTYENYQVSSQPRAFSFACCGDNHAKTEIGANMPAYHSETGLIDHR